MDCQEVSQEELAEKYLRGGLDPAAQDNFEVHMLECKNCLQAVEALQAAREGLSQRAPGIRFLPVPAGFRWPRLALAGGLAVACVLGVVYVRRVQNGRRATAAKHLQIAPPVVAAKPQESQSQTKGTAVELTGARATTANVPSPGSSPGKSGQPEEPAKIDARNSPVAPAESSGSPSPPSQDQTAVAAAHPPAAASKPEGFSDAEEAELFRLGTVQAPPYTFPGLASGNPKASPINDSGFSGGGPPQAGNSKRPDFQQAMLAYVDGRYPTAVGLLEDDLKTEPQAGDANFFLGVCRLLLGRPSDSVAPLKAALGNDKSSLQQSAHFYLAKAYIQMRQLTDAEPELRAAGALPGPLKAEADSELARLKALRAQ